MWYWFKLIAKNKNNVDKPKFQFKLTINNQTSTVGIGKYWNVQFYLDMKLNGQVRDDKNFTNISNGPYDDAFQTHLNTIVTIYTTELDTQDGDISIDFTFGTIYTPYAVVWYHAQLTSASNYKYNFYQAYVLTGGDNGAELNN